ncbi:MAG: UDP-N-acetylmuramoyl-L-alanine--D-glutamate ligase [Victivallales bacterium]
MKKIENVIILGLGISGRAAVELALKKGFKVCAFDEKTPPGLEGFMKSTGDDRLDFRLEWKNGKLPDADLIVISPGISNTSPLGQAATRSKIPVISELEFGFRFCKTPILAVTGTNGKTTTTELTCHLLNSIGRKSAASGNIGIPLSKSVLDPDKYDFLVVETSSFQLDGTANFAPEAAALLNITSDHMNRYETEKDYAKSKFRVFKNIKSPGNRIMRSDLLPYWNEFFPGAEKPVTISCSDETADYYFDRNGEINIGGKAFMGLSETQLQGAHNAENLMASLALVFSVIPEPPLDLLKKGICGFRTGSHRLEIVGKSNGITYINDSKATNPDSLIVALRAVGAKKNVCLIAGGLDKNMDFTSVLDEKDRIKAVFLAGECKNKLANLWKNDISCVIFNTFEDAVTAACDKAEPGDVVLLSPGCASMDMFKDYKDRGQKFTLIINRRFESE